MMETMLIATATSTALVSGVFFAFSSFVMGALGRLDSRAGIAAMQSINVVVINPVFFAAFFGAGLLCVVSTILTFQGGADERILVLIGSVLYIFGCLGVTIVGNVPLNNRLAAVDPMRVESIELWNFYLERWTRWNHVRTIASLAAAVTIAAALAVR